ncbi:phosphoenolpyruvate--protein phosphotransferase [Candidatus Sumerlaeota bacterium]|nr:phosphoenolpyruvate--protein phosphotransferase [Candidatus Sumerlaeota bacterium]
MPRSARRPPRHPQRHYIGIPAAPGIVIGPAHVYSAGVLTVEPHPIPAARVEEEIRRFLQAVDHTKEQIRLVRSRVEEEIDMAHGAIFDSHLRVLEDPLLIDATVDEIRSERLNAEFIFHRNIQRIGSMLAKIKDEHFRDRDVDLLDVGQGVTQKLMGQVQEHFANLQRDVIVVATELSPSDTAQMGSASILGIVCATGGPTSHTAILAKALELPSVLGVGSVDEIMPGSLLIVDGNEGKVIANPTPDTLASYRRARTRSVRRSRDMAKLRDLPAETVDGFRISLAANIELPQEVDHVIEHGGQGVGLFRTEFLFLSSHEPPDEETQLQVYSEVARRLRPAPVIFRTIDLGGDKFLNAPDLGRELNPFLGLRAIRLCLDQRDLFMTQLRAILRASARGNVHIMLPLISSVEEVRQSRALIDTAREDLLSEGHPLADRVPLGIMIETPSAALTADVLAGEVDFFSIGTNDLIQYTLAVDRVNEKVAQLYQPLHPSVLRLIRTAVDAAHREGIWCGVCGEMAADPDMTPILLGFGVDELSMSAVAIPRVKETIRRLRLNECEQMAEDLLSRSTVREVQVAARRHLQRLRRGAASRSRAQRHA